MERTMSRHIFIILVIFMILGVSYVFAQGPPNHLGEICITCHQKYSDNNAISRVSPCSKKACHQSNPTNLWGARGTHDRYPLHLQERICGNCHIAKDGRFDIHSIHMKFGELGIDRTPVECRICHWSPEGYNTSLAQVPAYGNLHIAGSTLMNASIRILPWNNDCGYCHPSTIGARRMHDIHEPGIKNACPECHGKAIESRLDLIEEVTHGEVPVKKSVEGKPVIVQVFLDLFEEIARYFLKISS